MASSSSSGGGWVGGVSAEEARRGVHAFLRAAPNRLRAVEAELCAMAREEGGAAALAEVASDASESVHARQFAATLLRTQVAECGWAEVVERGRGEEAARVREKLSATLGVRSRPLRVAVARALGRVAGEDWPERWPDVAEALLRAAQGYGEDETLSDGAARALTFLAPCVRSQDAVEAWRQLAGGCLELASAGDAPGHVRARSLRVVGSLLRALHQAADRDAASHAAVGRVVRGAAGGLVGAAGGCLEGADLTTRGGCALARLALSVLQRLLTDFAWCVDAKVVRVALSGQLAHAFEVVGHYVRAEVDSEEGLAGEEEGYDSEDVVAEGGGKAGAVVMEHLAFLDQMLTASPTWVRAHVDDVVRLCVVAGQVVSGALARWEEDPVAQAVQDSENPDPTSPRGIVAELLVSLVRELGVEAALAVARVTGQVAASAAEPFVAADEVADGRVRAGRAWKMHESAVRLLGAVAPAVVRRWASRDERATEPLGPGDWEEYLLALVSSGGASFPLVASASDDGETAPWDARCSAPPDGAEGALLASKALWCASRLSAALSYDAVASLTRSALEHTAPTSPLALRLGACNAIRRLLRRLRAEDLAPVADRMLHALPAILLEGGAEAAEALLEPSMMALARVVRSAPCDVVVARADEVADRLLHLWMLARGDAHLAGLLAGCLATLIGKRPDRRAPTSECALLVARRALPFLQPLLREPAAELQRGSGSLLMALELVRGFAERAPTPHDPVVTSAALDVLALAILDQLPPPPGADEEGGEEAEGAEREPAPQLGGNVLGEGSLHALASFAQASYATLQAAFEEQGMGAEDAVTVLVADAHFPDPLPRRADLATTLLALAKSALRWVPPSLESAATYAPRLAAATLFYATSQVPSGPASDVLALCALRRLTTAVTPPLVRELVGLWAEFIVRDPDAAAATLAAAPPLPSLFAVQAYVVATAGGWSQLDACPSEGAQRHALDPLHACESPAVVLAECFLRARIHYDSLGPALRTARNLYYLALATLLTVPSLRDMLRGRVTPQLRDRWLEGPLLPLLARALAGGALQLHEEDRPPRHDDSDEHDAEPDAAHERGVVYEDTPFLSREAAEEAGLVLAEGGGGEEDDEDDDGVDALRAMMMGDMAGIDADVDFGGEAMMESDDDDDDDDDVDGQGGGEEDGEVGADEAIDADDGDSELWARMHVVRAIPAVPTLLRAVQQLSEDEPDVFQRAIEQFPPAAVARLEAIVHEATRA